MPLKVQFPLLGYNFVILSSDIIPDNGEPLWTNYPSVPYDQLIFLDVKSTGNNISGFLHNKQGYFLHDYMVHLADEIMSSVQFFVEDAAGLALLKASTTPALSTGNKHKQYVYNGTLIDLSVVKNNIMEDDLVQDCFVTYNIENGSPRTYICVQEQKY